LKASEKNVGNRGSKSNSIKFVKEQRADGSYINQKINDLVLRCALREVRKKDLAGIPSNQILNKRLHESFGHPQPPKRRPRSTTKYSKNLQPQLAKGSSLNPWFITGFTDGDGSFTISIAKKKSGIG
jgi:hypothetical protein